MNVGIIDADLLGRKNHRFPNLACEKISAFWKEKGASVVLLDNYFELDNYDQIFISKVFTDTPLPAWIQESDTIHLGGTGFYFDKAPNLPFEIEHHMPDYHLYDEWISNQLEIMRVKYALEGKPFNEAYQLSKYKEYLDYSIGFITRGCFRKCGFCVNKKFDHVFEHSPIEEFYDPSRKKICLLDDNFLGCPNWKVLLEELIELGRPFKFKQGLDERLLTEEKCELLFSSKYDGDFTFAFDNIADYPLIEKKLELIRQYTSSTSIKFYVLVGFDSVDEVDIENAFKRIALLMKYKCLPYIMRYQNKNFAPWKEAEWRGMYVSLARWCNQPNIFKKMSFRQFCEANQALHKTNGYCSSMESMMRFEKKHPCIAAQYFDLRFEDC